MRGRYFTAPSRKTERAYWDDDPPLLPNLSVPDHEATDTGLLDVNGDTIWRALRPIGFIWGDEF